MNPKLLVERLNYYTQKYDEGQPEITDQEWDELYWQLVELEQITGIIYPDSPTQKISYQVVSALPKVEHNHPMLSLNKTKNIDEIQKFCGQTPCVAMLKMDGLTCSLKYEKGQLVSAETRGNGLIGEDITHNAQIVSSIPKQIPYQGTMIIDGEIICDYDSFKQFANEYANPRNFAAGSIRLLDSNACAARHLTFVAWDLINGQFNTLTDKLQFLATQGFVIVPYDGVKLNKLDTQIEELRKLASKLQYPIDGLVFKKDNVVEYEAMGRTEHHFSGGLALKFYDETYETTLLDIEYTMGRTSVLTPVAIFEEIDTGDSRVNRASLHNLSIMETTLGSIPYTGQPIKVAKMNMIIPQIVEADINDEPKEKEIKKPTKCPYCGSPLQATSSDSGTRVLSCTNANCTGLLINRLDHFVGKKGLDIRGLSTATLGKLYEYGWVNTLSDIFHLDQYVNEWVQKPGFGMKSVTSILHAITECRTTELWTFISAIGIPLIGSTYAKTLAKKFETWSKFREAVDAHYKFHELEGFGAELTHVLWYFDYAEADAVAAELNIVNALTSSSVGDILKGLNFVITGSLQQFKNRDELKSKIEANGGKVAGAVSKNTSYLINNDFNSTSSKNATAKKFGIEIISEQEFLQKFF